jgi:hypothetical protein
LVVAVMAAAVVVEEVHAQGLCAAKVWRFQAEPLLPSTLLLLFVVVIQVQELPPKVVQLSTELTK